MLVNDFWSAPLQWSCQYLYAWQLRYSCEEGETMPPTWSPSSTSYLRISSMQSRQTVHIMAAEWRWVILVGSALVLLAISPLLWVALRGTPGWQFMGVLHNYLDGST